MKLKHCLRSFWWRPWPRSYLCSVFISFFLSAESRQGVLGFSLIFWCPDLNQRLCTRNSTLSSSDVIGVLQTPHMVQYLHRRLYVIRKCWTRTYSPRTTFVGTYGQHFAITTVVTKYCDVPSLRLETVQQYQCFPQRLALTIGRSLADNPDLQCVPYT